MAGFVVGDAAVDDTEVRNSDKQAAAQRSVDHRTAHDAPQFLVGLVAHAVRDGEVFQHGGVKCRFRRRDSHHMVSRRCAEVAAQHGFVSRRIGHGPRCGIGRITALEGEVAVNLEGLLLFGLAAREQRHGGVGPGCETNDIAVAGIFQSRGQRRRLLPRKSRSEGVAVGLDIIGEILRSLGRKLGQRERRGAVVGNVSRDRAVAFVARAVAQDVEFHRPAALSVDRGEHDPRDVALQPPRKI